MSDNFILSVIIIIKYLSSPLEYSGTISCTPIHTFDYLGY